MKFYVLLLLAIYVVGCVGKPEKAYLLDSTNIEDMTNRKFDLSAQVRDWDYVVLEQNDSCCLTNISRLKIVGDDVFVVNVEAILFPSNTDCMTENQSSNNSTFSKCLKTCSSIIHFNTSCI